MEHLSLPYDPASRRLFGVPIVATVSEAAGVGHVLALDAVALDADSSVSGCSGRRRPAIRRLPRRRLQYSAKVPHRRTQQRSAVRSAWRVKRG